MGKLRIHPAIGVARVGNAESPAVPPIPFTKFFIGPENPGVPANWDDQSRSFKSFKDGGKVLRQAARFRIFQFDDAGNPENEVTLADGFKIEWRVHVANRKASFYTFNGQSGARSDTDPPYVGRARRPADDTERSNKGRGDPERKNRRNAAIGFDPGGNKANVQVRRGLEIDPGEVAISAPGFKDLIDLTTQAPIQFLGQIQMQPDGRLLFLGGSGDTRSTPNAAPIEQYANNDGWFDDVCDGIIHATVTFPDGHTEDSQPAWIIVGPPKFAPGIGHVVPLYDMLWDLAVRSKLPCQAGNDAVLQDLVAQQQAWQEATNDFAPIYQPSFTTHIYPILARALAARDVHEPPPGRPGYHATLIDWELLSKRDENQIRHGVFNRIRNPNAAGLNRKDMPRGLGDDYTSLELFEEDLANNPPPSPRAFLGLTKVQYALLKAWDEDRFSEDWTFGVVKYAPIPSPGPVTPHGLDRSALENCVGGPFYPGIEISWLVRELGLYAEAFRFNDVGGNIGTPEFPLTIQAGFFSQQMALPWQADFYDCHKEEHTPPGERERFIYMWWTAQRPDDIRSDASGDYRRWVEPFDAAKDAAAPDPDDITNLARFEQMRTRWSELSFVVLEGGSVFGAEVIEFDVLVVGAGIAGCATAIELRSFGWRVGVLRQCQSSHSVESLSPEASRCLDRFAIDVGTGISEIVAWWGSEREKRAIYSGARIAERSALADSLRKRAIERGADFFNSEGGFRIEPFSAGSRWCVEVARPISKPHKLRTEYLVDATGRASLLARKLDVRRQHLDQLFCISANLIRPKITGTWTESSPDGWWNLCCTPDEGTISFYSTAPIIREYRRNLIAHFHRTQHLRPLIDEAMLSTPYVRTCGSSRLASYAGPRWISVGDASWTVQPLASAGVAKALRDAGLAREALETAPDGYDRFQTAEFASYLGHLAKQYALEKRWSTSPFWQSIGALGLREKIHHIGPTC